jgi:WD40 repeat protein/mono/diheme cytochrome c family protein
MPWLRSFAVVAAGFSVATFYSHAAPKPAEKKEPVSYYKQIRPIFQAQCQGCHQPAKAKGDFVMTDVAKLLGTGESGKKAIVPGKPDASYLLAQIIPAADGKAEMPRNAPPMAAMEIDLVRKWIAEGAKDDTPKNAVQHIDAAHPPEYKRPPTITSLDYSPDGKLLAVAGFHEVLLHKADGSGMVGRLVGLAERIETVRFSPDGKSLAVAGGLPARMGEVQIWDVEKRKLTLSVPVTYDTVYGVSWSPDGKLVAFGCSDKTVRAVDVSNGKQVLQQMSHNDWVLDTAFTTNGSHVISTGRDMSAKLTETATQRFIDNITSITPGALRGGLHSVARHPSKDEVLVGGSDGIPQIYVVFRKAARKIGDNANLVRRFPAMEGRIFGVAYSPDGNRIVAGSSSDGRGAVNIYAAAFDATIPTNILKAYEKVASTYSPEEKEAIEKFLTQDIKLIASAQFDVPIYAVSFSPDGKTVAAGGEDGWIRLLDPGTGKVASEFMPAPVSKQLAQRVKGAKR